MEIAKSSDEGETFDDEKVPRPGSMKMKTKAQAMAMESLVKIAKLVDKMLPSMIYGYNLGNEQFTKYKALWMQKVPPEINYLLMGGFLCFYGGNFPALIATITAIQQSGQLPVLKKSLLVVFDQAKQACLVIQDEELVKALDENRDGYVSYEEIASGLQKQGRGLIMMAMPLVLKRLDPNVMNEAVTSIWAIWCSIMITLQSVFARQVSMGMRVGEIISGTAKLYISPMIAAKLEKEYKIWADYTVLVGCKICGVVVAMFLAKMIGAFTSAMQGGDILSRGAITTAKQYGIVVAKDTRNLQLIVMYVFGGLGFYYQLSSGFSLNIFLKLLFLPATVVEMILSFFVYRA